MLTLGLSGHYGSDDVDLAPGIPRWYMHDAAACLVADGELVAAVEQERFNRIKHTTKFPVAAIRACLDLGGVGPEDVDAVGYYFGEEFSDIALNTWYAAIPTLPARTTRQVIQDKLHAEFDWRVPDDRLQFTAHHLSHARSSFTRSGMGEALVVVMDGRSEDDSTSIFRGEGDKLEKLATYSIAQSLGLFYMSAINLVRYGFGDEYKVMGLAPYGDPAVYRDVFHTLYTLHDHGQYELTKGTVDMHLVAATFRSAGLWPRRAGEPVTQQHMDFAAGLQEMLETVSLHVVSHWAEATGLSKLCFVGGVAHNSSLNGVLLRSGLFEEVFVHPASHDAGAAEGAALEAAQTLGDRPARQPRMRTASLGGHLGTRAEVERTLRGWSDLVEYERPDDIVTAAAGLLAEGAVLGWAHGRSEFGPRALGNRSIIADARPAENRTRINAMVKKRESFRPFAPAVTPEDAATYFDLTGTKADHEFMSFVVHVHPDRRDELGAVTHVDGSARLQVVDPGTNQRFYRLIKAFGELTGTPVLLNTSFNNDAEPIVETATDVITSFLTTGLDALVIEDFLVRRRDAVLPALDGLVPRLRPVTRLKEEWNPRAAGAASVRHVYLSCTDGPRAEVSSPVFDLLRFTDGASTLGALAERHLAGPLTDAVREELFGLWQQRYFSLTPQALA
ncbi:carbamoyltransferase family protein [Saccharothrix australiensis]|uniref:Decarbamoylnovobiocin carbamoyltransferase/7-O-carbamoyltransferase n=1 Tax=Saccharothrix australiensis TaxID=2072 RepID=A0A495VWH1_9PSEU|nr:carbamoyltransferase C-terminal domain-containing protein [Saccharothrix australiensis]RKT53761.1 decarbamoylnovobiocin carbamoyltransferase/7-O-carbamoyltransferase [Saccharothrix australiensis]